MLCADDFPLVRESFEDPKELQVWKGVLEASELRMNLKKTNMIIGSEIAGKVTEEGKFPCAVWRKDVKVRSWEQNTFIPHLYVVLCFVEVTSGQLRGRCY